MRRIIVVALSAALLTTTAWVVHGAAAGSTRAAGATKTAAATGGAPTDERVLERGTRIANPVRPGDDLATQLARARLATGRYATNLRAAKADGYQIITRMIPDMGWHFLNPTIQGFDVTKPAILVYERHGRRWQLGALEWVFPQQPEVPLLPGATYGSFGAACHYRDGTFMFARVRSCAPSGAQRRAPGSTSGIPTWSPCTSGSGTPTPTASTTAPIPWSAPSTTARRLIPRDQWS